MLFKMEIFFATSPFRFYHKVLILYSTPNPRYTLQIRVHRTYKVQLVIRCQGFTTPLYIPFNPDDVIVWFMQKATKFIYIFSLSLCSLHVQNIFLKIEFKIRVLGVLYRIVVVYCTGICNVYNLLNRTGPIS